MFAGTDPFGTVTFSSQSTKFVDIFRGKLNDEEMVNIEECTEWETLQQIITTCLF